MYNKSRNDVQSSLLIQCGSTILNAVANSIISYLLFFLFFLQIHHYNLFIRKCNLPFLGIIQFLTMKHCINLSLWWPSSSSMVDLLCSQCFWDSAIKLFLFIKQVYVHAMFTDIGLYSHLVRCILCFTDSHIVNTITITLYKK